MQRSNKSAVNYALIGAAGFIAPRHMKAIKDTGGNLVAALDKNDSVGVLDSYFPSTNFFTEFESFDRYLNKKDTNKIDFLVVCTPNYLHDAHIRYGLRMGMNVICEKPLVIKYHNLENLRELEKDNKVYTILQLRLHPQIKSLNVTGNHLIEINYNTPRGKWYDYSWKGDKNKSGGLLYNIGIHFFDLLIHKFGNPTLFKIVEQSSRTVRGILHLEHGYCVWSLSIDGSKEPLREIKVDGKMINLSEGFNDAHTTSYREIIEGRGFDIEQAGKAIKLLSDLK